MLNVGWWQDVLYIFYNQQTYIWSYLHFLFKIFLIFLAFLFDFLNLVNLNFKIKKGGHVGPSPSGLGSARAGANPSVRWVVQAWHDYKLGCDGPSTYSAWAGPPCTSNMGTT